MVISQRKQRVLLGVPVALLLGMGSFWFVLRDLGPKQENVVDVGVVERGPRSAPVKNADKPPRVRHDQDKPEEKRGERGRRPQNPRPNREQTRRGGGGVVIEKKDPEQRPMG